MQPDTLKRCKVLNIPPFSDRPNWMKSRGYLHITPKLDIRVKYKELYTKIVDEKFVARHGFFPLIHSTIKERKFKKIPSNSTKRAHSYFEKGKFIKSAKQRPLHYSTHIDALIFGYYADELQKLYEAELKRHEHLSDCVTAYRKIEIEGLNIEEVDPPGKSTIHFANEAFDEIKKRAKDDCIVLMFDIKSFFSEINHDILKKAWCDLLKTNRLNAAHYNVFKAATDFRYILKDDLRINRTKTKKKAGFNESKLALIRTKIGAEAFFESIKDFKIALKNKNLTVYKHPFRKNNQIVGIPQGLPISAVLANLYLLDFDKEILSEIVIKLGGFYRRYSDDILIICKPNEKDIVENFVLKAIKKRELEISVNKTETFLFKPHQISPKKKRIISIQLLEKIPLSGNAQNNKSLIGKPLTYLGFEFYGNKTLIKSANLAKFYRRMILLIKRKASRAIKISEKEGISKPAVFRKQLQKNYKIRKLEKEIEFTKRKKWIKQADGTYSFKMIDIPKKNRTNYFSYVKRASIIMNDDSINKQLKKHKQIFNLAISRHLKKKIPNN